MSFLTVLVLSVALLLESAGVFDVVLSGVTVDGRKGSGCSTIWANEAVCVRRKIKDKKKNGPLFTEC